MEELGKKFVEPVVLGRRPFEMLVDVAREAVVRTHELVVKLTAKAGEPSDAHRDSEASRDSAPATFKSK